MAVTITDASLQGIYNRLHAIPEYHPLDAQTFADWSVEAGDVVTVSRENDSYSSPVHTSRMVWKGTPEVTLQSTGRKEREPISRVSKKKYGRGGGGIRQGQAFYHDIYDPTGTVHSEISNTERGFEAKLSGVVDKYGNVTGSSIATAINAAGQAGARINGAWVEINAQYNLTLSDVITVTPGVTVMKNTVVFGNTQGNTSSIAGGEVRANSYQWHSGLNTYDVDYATLAKMIKSVELNNNTLKITRFDDTYINFSKATALTSGWSGSVGVDTGRTFKVSAVPQDIGIDPVELKLYDGNFHNILGTWNENVYTGKIVYSIPAGAITQYADTGVRYEVDATPRYDAGISFQTGKMIPFAAPASNSPYNSRFTTSNKITSNGTYYACAEGYKSHNEGYDNDHYSADRYAQARAFVVDVENVNPYPYTRTMKCVSKTFSSSAWVYRFEIEVSSEVWDTNTNYKFHHNSGYT